MIISRDYRVVGFFLMVGIFILRFVIQSNQQLAESIKEMSSIREFFQYVEMPTQTCKHPKQFGGVTGNYKKIPVFDGEKVVCLDKEFEINPGNCTVYSFGISNEWSFDDAMAGFGCQIYAFDPTMGKENHKRGDNIIFYKLGISGKDEVINISNGYVKNKPCEVKRFTSIMKLLGHEYGVMIDYLKMDVEGAEIPFLEDVLQNSPQILQKIKQIGMEIHLGKFTESTVDIFEKNYKLFKQLESHGFKLFSSKWNPYPFNKYYLNEVGRDVNRHYELVWGLWPGSH